MHKKWQNACRGNACINCISGVWRQKDFRQYVRTRNDKMPVEEMPVITVCEEIKFKMTADNLFGQEMTKCL